jgi:hypothetical protein
LKLLHATSKSQKEELARLRQLAAAAATQRTEDMLLQ